MKEFVDRTKVLVQRLVSSFRDSRPGRALARYNTGRGALMAGGIAYTGLFSVFAALTVGMSAVMAILGRHPAMRDAVVSSVEDSLPGVIKTETAPNGLVTVEQLTLSSALTVGSVIAALTLLYTAMGLMGTLSSALNAMFGLVRIPRTVVATQLWNLLGFVVLVLGVVITAVAAVVTGTLAGVVPLPAWVTGPVATAATLAVSFLVDGAVLGVVITACGVRPPWRDMFLGCALGALVFGILRQVGTRAVGSIANNPVLASVAAISVLVLWLHLASRTILLVAAWMANPPRPREIDHPDEVHFTERPNYVTLTVPETLQWPRQTMSGSVEIDPTAHPSYEAPEPVARGVEALEEDLAEVVGAREGLRAHLLRRRYARAISSARRAKQDYSRL